jgi:VanZ family protein
MVLAWMVLETFWSSQSNLPIDHPPVSTLLFGLQHRFAHLIAFGVLALLARWAFEGFPRARLLAILLTSVFGATDELHQIFTPRRHPGIDDWAVDTLAACLAMLAWPRVFGHGRGVVRMLVPAAIASVFVVETVLGVSAAHPRLPTQLRHATAEVVPIEARQAARELARSTRSLASRL